MSQIKKKQEIVALPHFSHVLSEVKKLVLDLRRARAAETLDETVFLSHVMVWQEDRKRRRKRKIHRPPHHIYEVGRLADGEKEKPVFDRRGLSVAEVEKEF